MMNFGVIGGFSSSLFEPSSIVVSGIANPTPPPTPVTYTPVSISIRFLYTDPPVVRTSTKIVYNLNYVNLYPVVVPTYIRYNIKQDAKLSTSFGFKYHFTKAVGRSFGFKYDLQEQSPITTSFRMKYTLQAKVAQHVNSSPTLTINGSNVQVSGVQLSTDEQSSVWLGTFELDNANAYFAINLRDTVTLSFSGETYNLIVDGKQMVRTDGSTTFSVTAISPIALYKSPFAVTMNYSLSNGTYASEVINELLGGGVTYNAYDWVVPANQLSFVNTTPYDIASTVVQTIGAVIESNPDGSIVVRSIYPVNIQNYESATPNFVFDDSDLISSQEQISPTQVFNILTVTNDTISNGSASGDALEYISHGRNNGILHAYPSPWRDVTVANTGDSNVAMTYVDTYYRQVTETVAFVNGVASTQYPVTSIDNMTWVATNLGSVTYSGTALTSTVTSSSLLTLTYTVISKAYSITNTDNAQVLFALMDS